MAIYSKLSNIRKLTNSSLGSIIEVSNLNFNDLSNALLEFLNNVSYDETTNTIEGLDSLNVKYINVDNNLSIKLNGLTTFNIDSQGRAEGNSFLVEVAEAKRYRHTDFNNWPDLGIPGEIIYTGIQNQKPEFGEDFIGYLDGRGWVSLTGGGGLFYQLTLLEQLGSPGIPDTPALGSGIVWIGDPGLETHLHPTTQDLYFTDENGQIFSLTCCGGGGGGGTNASYVETTSFTANVTKTISHGLGTNSVVVDFIDTTTGDRVDAHIDNYVLNAIDVTFTQDVSSVRVVVVSAGGGTGDGLGIFHTVTSDLTIPENAMYIVWGDLTIDPGVTLINDGRLVIVNGNFIQNGTYIQNPTGSLEQTTTNISYVLNQGNTTFGNHILWTDNTNVWNPGDSTSSIDSQTDNAYVTKEWVNNKKYVEEYLSTGGLTWDTITHNLNSQDVIVQVWDMDATPGGVVASLAIRNATLNTVEIQSSSATNLKAVIMA